jgi:hypothetical protein
MDGPFLDYNKSAKISNWKWRNYKGGVSLQRLNNISQWKNCCSDLARRNQHGSARKRTTPWSRRRRGIHREDQMFCTHISLHAWHRLTWSCVDFRFLIMVKLWRSTLRWSVLCLRRLGIFIASRNIASFGSVRVISNEQHVETSDEMWCGENNVLWLWIVDSRDDQLPRIPPLLGGLPTKSFPEEEIISEGIPLFVSLYLEAGQPSFY